MQEFLQIRKQESKQGKRKKESKENATKQADSEATIQDCESKNAYKQELSKTRKQTLTLRMRRRAIKHTQKLQEYLQLSKHEGK